jgi:hypothetical protein
VWLCDDLPLPVRGGERHFLSSQFSRELKKKEHSSTVVLAAYELFIKEVNAYRQVWVHTLTGGALPRADVNPFEYPQTADRYKIGDFTARIFDGASAFYLDWLQFALRQIA